MKHTFALLAALLLAPLAALHAADVRTEAWTEKWPDKTGQLQGAAEIEKAISKHKLRPLLSFPAARKVHLSDFGAAADGKQDDYPALRKAIQSLLAQNDDGSAVELIFPKGTYRFNAPAHEVVFVLNERSNIIINGNHSEFRFSNAFTRLGEFKKCNNIIIKDFTIKYDNVGQIVGEITDVNLSDDTAPYIIVRAEEPYVESLTHSAKVFSDYDSSSGRRPYDHFYLAREVNGEYVPYSTVNSKPFKVINSNTVKIPFAAKRVVPEAIQTGLKVLMPNRGSRMLLPGGTDNLTVSGLKVHGYSGAFIFAISCVNLSVLNCEFISDGKGFSLCAGGIISVNSYGHWLEGNIINGCSDDGINIVNTAPIFVRDRISPNVLKMDSDARHLNVMRDVRSFYKEGDVLEFQSRKNGTIIAEAVITHIDVANKVFTFDRSLPEFFITKERYLSDCAYNKSQKTFDVVRGNVLSRIHGRGISISGDHVLIENNKIRHTKASAIEASTLGKNANHYRSHNFIIRNNEITEANIFSSYPAERANYGDASISFSARDFYFKLVPFINNRNIFIHSNSIKNWYYKAISMVSSEDVVIFDNTIISEQPVFGGGFVQGVNVPNDNSKLSVFYLDNVRNVQIFSNTISDTRAPSELSQGEKIGNLVFKDNALTSPPADGLVPKFCKLTVADGAARVEADGRTPFLGTAQIKASGPITLKLRARSTKGGPGKVQWVTQDQTEFPATGQTVAFTLPAGSEWQDITVDIPLTGDLRLLRLYLPADKSPVEIASIQYTGKTGKFKTWNFTLEKK